MNSFIPYTGGFLAPQVRDVYQGYDNPESPDNVRASMGQEWAPPADYYGLDGQGNRKRFTYDNGQLAGMYEQHAGAQAAAMLQDARLKKAKSDLAFMNSFRGGAQPPLAGGQASPFNAGSAWGGGPAQLGPKLPFNPAPGAYGNTYVPPGSDIRDSGMRNANGGTVPLIIPPNVQQLMGQGGQGSSPNVFDQPRTPDEARLQQLLQNRADAETRGWNLFGAGLRQNEINDAKARQRAKEDFNTMDQAVKYQNALKAQREQMDLNWAHLDQGQQNHDDQMQNRKLNNFVSAIESGEINSVADIARMGGGGLAPDDLAVLKGRIAQRNGGIADNIGQLIASGKVQSMDQLDALEGGRLSSDQYTQLRQLLGKQQAGQADEYAQNAAPFAEQANTDWAKKQAAFDTQMKNAGHWYWPSSADTEKAAIQKQQEDALKQFTNSRLTDKKFQNVTVDPSGKFVVRPLPSSMTDATAFYNGTNAPAPMAPQRQIGLAPFYQGEIRKVSSETERAALPSGTRYIGPDGLKRVKQ